jgi:hypothetical protein
VRRSIRQEISARTRSRGLSVGMYAPEPLSPRVSIHPLPGEFQVPIYCVAPSRSSLYSGFALLFLFIAFLILCFPCGIVFYYIHRQFICQLIRG